MKTEMTKRISAFLTIIVLSLFTFIFNGSAQTNDSGAKTLQLVKAQILQLDRDKAIRVGYKYLNGINVKLDYLKAYVIFRTLAENGDAEANNVLGMMYKQGTGPKQNDEKALYYFQKAVDGGYAKAAYNIALMYKFGHGVEQDYSKYIKWLEKAAQMGYEKTDYLMGYAYYKGFGEKQNYQTAFQYFEQGAQKGDATCMYMLSLCYFYGRGVDRNVKQGKFWMEEAANKGVDRAIDIMAKNNSETYGEKMPNLKSSVINDVNEMIPVKYAVVKNDKNIVSSDISGKWEGNIVQYDWSGEDITKTGKLELTIDNPAGNEISGLWVENDTMSVKVNATVNDSTWIFNNVRLYAQQRPLNMTSGSFRIVNKDGNSFLIGNISFYSETIREYTAPCYIALERKSNAPTGIDLMKGNMVTVTPNPFNEQITVQINLDKAQKLQINIYDLSGKRIETGEFLEYKAGAHTIKISTANYPKGSYILKVTGGIINQSFTIVK